MGKAYSHLSEEERQVIQIEVGNGTSVRKMARLLGRSPSSISREIKRNTWFPSNENESYWPYRPKRLKTGPWTGRCYIAGPAQRRADRRRAKPRKRYRLSCERLWARVAEWLGCGWSPLPIGGRLRVLFPDDSAMRVCPETVYRWIHADRHRRERWARCLPRGHRRRRRRGGRRTSRFPIPGRVPISERPPEAGGRSGFGHWEADSVIGAGCNLHTEVERKTRFLMAGIVPGKTAGESVGAQLAMFSPLPAGARVSVTHDNGTEFVRRTRLRDELGMDTYFADPYSSWQRGSNENRNGMIRRYLPKRSEIRMDMAGELREIVDEVNNRPMRVLGYRTPAEAFADELLELQDQQGRCTSK
ncbi:IS30 family transposase [Bifidobacterium pseudocatenulatum]|uniref:IS30 family transposase n=1 Tax=Bifidobacterium pseudocatenulatum TaxID=28026 RepID=UPI0022DE9B6D|nr:IS30 family transposase [Bifidobacterium pseudocatenulatum]